MPIRLPADDALEGSARDAADVVRPRGGGGAARFAGAELFAPASFERPFLDDGTIILREVKDDVPGWLWTAAIVFIFAVYALFITAIALGVARITRREPAAPGSPETGEPLPDALPRTRSIAH